jgi:hypothetical protein
MSDRRRVHVKRSGSGTGLLPDRRIRWMDRRQHHGLTRILFMGLDSLWYLLRTGRRASGN